jgi:hypothetical protein
MLMNYSRSPNISSRALTRRKGWTPDRPHTAAAEPVLGHLRTNHRPLCSQYAKKLICYARYNCRGL